jgi:hypothetical protein
MRLTLWFAVPVAALTPIVLSYVVNQLPEFPNKAQNAPWIIAAAIVLSFVVIIIAVVQARTQSNSATSVKRNRMKGKGNQIIVNRQATVTDNSLDGEDNHLSIDEDSSTNRRFKP